MEYFVPAWHGKLADWAYNVPHIQFYDAINQMRVLQDNGKKIGMIIPNYQPQLTSKLNQLVFYPDNLFSVYDYLQGIDQVENQILDYTDFKWPEEAFFDFTPFRIMVISANRLYAQIIFDNDGKILSVVYFDENKQLSKTLTIDSRGFVSSEEVNDEVIYFDQIGHWRFKYNKQTDQVTMNDVFNPCNQDQYLHLSDLISEVFEDRVLPKIKAGDHLIASLDDQSALPVQALKQVPTIYSVSQWNEYTHSLLEAGSGQMIVDSHMTANRVEGLVDRRFDITVMPPFQTQFKLGHSQRSKRQIIGVFAEHMSYQELKQITEMLYQRLMNNPTGEGVHFLTYSSAQDNLVNQVIDELKAEHNGEFTMGKSKEDPDEVKLESKKIPYLSIKKDRLTNTAEVMRALDKVRVLVSWNDGDDFLEMAAISVGVPQLQNYEPTTVVDRRNGWICADFNELNQGLTYFLSNLQNWNQALVYNVKILNQFSEENLMKEWQKIFGDEEL